MLTKTIALSAFILASGAVFSAPSASAAPQSDDFWAPFNSTDGGYSIDANIPDRPKVAPTSEQAAQLSFFEAQQRMTDGGPTFGAYVPDRTKLAPTPEQVAQLRFFEAQQRLSDGGPSVFAESDASGAPVTQASSRHAGAGENLSERWQ